MPNAIQTLSFAPPPNGGTYTLAINWETSGVINFNDPASTIQAALEALDSVGPGNISVSGEADTGLITLTFQGALANTGVPQTTCDASSLIFPSVTEIQAGIADEPAVPGQDYLGTVTLQTGTVAGSFNLTDGFGFTANGIPVSATGADILAALGGVGAVTNYSTGAATLQSVTGAAGGPWAFDIYDGTNPPGWGGFTATGNAATAASQTATFTSAVADGDTLIGIDFSILFYSADSGSPNDPTLGGAGNCPISAPSTLCQAVASVVNGISSLLTATADAVSSTTFTTVATGSSASLDLTASSAGITLGAADPGIDATPAPTWAQTQYATTGSPAVVGNPEVQDVPYPGGVAGAQWALNGETLTGNCATADVQAVLDLTEGSGAATAAQPGGAGTDFIVAWNSDGPQGLLSLAGEVTAGTTQQGSLPVAYGSVLKSAMISYEKVTA